MGIAPNAAIYYSMFNFNNEVPQTSMYDITKDYNEHKGKRITFFANVMRVSLKSHLIIVEGFTVDSFIRIPKKFHESLAELWEANNLLDVQIVAEGEPYFCRFRGIVGVKQGKILSMTGR